MASDSYIPGNSSSSTVICTFWTMAKPVAEKLDTNKFSVCANLYSMDGINTIARAILQNPHWRNLILFGADLTHTGDILTQFFEKGIEEDGKIAGTTFSFQKEIPREALNTLQKEVVVHDARGKSFEELIQLVNGLKNKPPFADPQTFPEPQPPEIQTFHSEKQGFLIRAPTISHGWLQVLDIILKFGEEKPTEYGNQMKELLNVQCIIEGDDENIPEFLPFTPRDLEDYTKKVLTPEVPPNVAYTYGSRLHAWPGEQPIDQVQYMIDYLKKTPHTRRAVAVTWHVGIDMVDKNPPCL
ncbi:MAG: thymidylate synthase, partial [archaeon]|nr:thymidylate synthase [archaeon]